MRDPVLHNRFRMSIVNSWGSQPLRVATGMMWLGLALATGLAGLAMADNEIPFTLVGAHSGTVTAIRGASLDINGKTFHLSPDAVIVDPQGQPVEADAIGVSTEVKYVVKRDQANKIVKMVVYLPR